MRIGVRLAVFLGGVVCKGGGREGKKLMGRLLRIFQEIGQD